MPAAEERAKQRRQQVDARGRGSTVRASEIGNCDGTAMVGVETIRATKPAKARDCGAIPIMSVIEDAASR
ncbi:hypothetical protein GCM10010994_60990 [Chelatococcus reniformis]|uniref:Uncharacterized protein n=1 Tax=Chelatococcus reniformis TaxID=1494448 RepID=A0A916XR83_9HYPH|nr:hypothetical protein GCM10010994_60990 [Chelatococcus reniformis]